MQNVQASLLNYALTQLRSGVMKKLVLLDSRKILNTFSCQLLNKPVACLHWHLNIRSLYWQCGHLVTRSCFSNLPFRNHWNLDWSTSETELKVVCGFLKPGTMDWQPWWIDNYVQTLRHCFHSKRRHGVCICKCLPIQSGSRNHTTLPDCGKVGDGRL